MVVSEEPALARREPPPDPQRTQFDEIVREQWTAVYKLLYTLTGNAHDTEDLTQETFLKALDRFKTFHGGNLRAWLLRIASNAFFDQRRRKQRVKFGPLAAEVPEESQPPDHRMDVAEQHQLLKAAMQELSETTRMVFHLRATENLSFREIAKILKTSEEAARWHMHQARTKLLAKVSPRPEGERGQ